MSFGCCNENPDTNRKANSDLQNGRHNASDQGAFGDASGITCRRSTREFGNEGADERADEGANNGSNDRSAARLARTGPISAPSA